MARLRALLVEAGYEERRVAGLLAEDHLALSASARAVYRQRLGADRLSSLVRLFLLHEAIDPPALAGDSDDLPELLARESNSLTATVAIQPWRDLLVCHDWLEGPPAPDHVVPVSAISTLLAHLTVRRQVERSLDIGTGSGIQALLAAAHSQGVVATDLSPRALRLATWTLELNGVENVEMREGSLFEPVGDESFDLIVSNPPFIVSPDRDLLFRDGEPDISRALVEGVPDRLRDGGFAHVLCQWPLASGERWDEQPRAWTANRGCDVWLLRVEKDQDPVEYAANWNRYLDTESHDFERALERWVTSFAETGVDRIAFGLVTLRRRRGTNWTRSDDLDGWPADPAGEHVARIFDGQTLVETLAGNDPLLDLVLAAAPGLRLDETRGFDGGGELVAAQVRLPGGVAVRPRLSRAAVETLGRLDGRTRLRDLDAESALPHLRELIALGFLVTET